MRRRIVGIDLDRPLTCRRRVIQAAEPDEVAGLIAYLASPQAASITVADFRIDGGLAKTAW